MRSVGWIVSTAAVASACAGAGDPEASTPEVAAVEVAASPEGSAPEVPNAPPPSAEPPRAEVPNAPPPSAEPPPLDERWLPALRTAVGLYHGWGRVDDEARWAPHLCRLPRPPSARFSDSGDEQTHGSKLYTLYAMDPVAYGARGSALPSDERPIEGIAQVIVKESFSPLTREEADAQGLEDQGIAGPHGLMPATRDGETFVAGPRRGLYVMMKTESDTRGTDAGWVYATLLPDDRTVTALGVVESCAGCHREAGPGRLFGLPGQEHPEPGSNRRRNANPRPL